MLNDIQKQIALELLDTDDLKSKTKEIRERMSISYNELMIRMGHKQYFPEQHGNMKVNTFIKVVKCLSEKGTIKYAKIKEREENRNARKLLQKSDNPEPSKGHSYEYKCPRFNKDKLNKMLNDE